MKLDSVIKNAVRPLTPEQRNILADSLRRDGQRTPLFVDKKTDILLDGYERLPLLRMLGKAPKLEYIEVSDPIRFRRAMNVTRVPEVALQSLVSEVETTLAELPGVKLTDLLDILREIWDDSIDLSLDKRQILVLWRVIADGGVVKDIPTLKRLVGWGDRRTKDTIRWLKELKSVQRWLNLFKEVK